MLLKITIASNINQTTGWHVRIGISTSYDNAMIVQIWQWYVQDMGQEVLKQFELNVIVSR